MMRKIFFRVWFDKYAFNIRTYKYRIIIGVYKVLKGDD